MSLSLPSVAACIAAQRGRLLLWAPVLLALGIGGYFALPIEPGRGAFATIAALAAAAAIGTRRGGETAGPLWMAVLLVAAGVLIAGARTHSKAAPVLDFRYYGPVEGRVVTVDRSVSDAVRVTLDDVVLARVGVAETPARVRVSLHGAQGFVTPRPGMRVMVTAHLSAPSGPVEPGGFDFRRHAWFLQIGAVGYARTPMLALAPPTPGEPVAALNRFRLDLAAEVRARLPGQTGAFAAAVMTGDRSGLSRETLDAMRDTNLAHLLAISGLHMGLLSGFVFLVVRAGLALVPWAALRWPTKKIAAIVALAAATGYLALSGGNVSTQRAFVMVSVMLLAVLMDRRALTLRSVAVAALIVLVLRPEALLGPGFQMSFAATTALVLVFSRLRDTQARVPRWARGAAGVFISSAVAGIATAPVAFAHFNQSATYGLIANLAGVPLMGSVVMPAGVLAAVLAPIGGAGIGLTAMGWGIDAILAIARTVSQWPDAVRYVPQPPGWVLPVLTLGALWAVLWQGRARIVGVAAFALAIAGWTLADRPAVLIAENGALVGVMGAEGRALSRARGHGFVARSWLENDGGGRDREAAHALSAPLREDGALWVTVAGAPLAVVFGAENDALDAVCARAGAVITNRDIDTVPTGCAVFGPADLRQSGALALRVVDGRARVASVLARGGQRPWSPRTVGAAASVARDLEAALNGPARADAMRTARHASQRQ